MKPYYFCLIFLLSLFLNSCKKNSELLPTEGYVETSFGKTWYRILGQGDKTPIITLHGGPGVTSIMFEPMKALSEERPIIFYDQLGSGRSYYHEDTSLMRVEVFVEQLHELIEAKNLKDYYIYGSSWGAALALEYYDKHPEGVKALMLANPLVSSTIWAADADTLIMTLPDSIQASIAEAEKTGNFESESFQNATFVFYQNFLMRGDWNGVSEWDTIPEKNNMEIYQYMWGPTEFTALGTLKNFDATGILEKIKVPTLFLVGEYDEARPVTVEKFHKKVEGSVFKIVEDAGHMTLNDNPEQNLEFIRQFISDVEK